MKFNLIKYIIIDITIERDDVIEFSNKFYESNEDRAKIINTLIVNNKTLEIKMIDAEITLSVKSEKLERIQNDTIVLNQETNRK